MPADLKKLRAAFYRTADGTEPVREWLHGFIKKTQRTPDADLALGRARQKDVQ